MKTVLALTCLFCSTQAGAGECREIKSFKHPVEIAGGLRLETPSVVSAFKSSFFGLAMRVELFRNFDQEKQTYRMKPVSAKTDLCQRPDGIWIENHSNHAIIFHRSWKISDDGRRFASWVILNRRPVDVCDREVGDVDLRSRVPLLCSGIL